MEKVVILLLCGLLASCVLEKNQNFELTVIHPETERGEATIDDGAGAQRLGHFTSKAYFGPQYVTLNVDLVRTSRSVFLGYENILHYYSIDGDGDSGTWTLGQRALSFRVGADWKVVKIHLAPETYKAPLALGSTGSKRRFLYQTNVSGQDEVWLGNTGGDPSIAVSSGLERGRAQPAVWYTRAWEGFPWVILGGSEFNTWVVSAANGTTTRLSSTAEESTNRYVQYGDHGLYFLTQGRYGQGSGVLKRLDPVTGTTTTLWAPPGESQSWIGPLTDTLPQSDDPVYLADSKMVRWEVRAPAPSTEALLFEERFLTLSQLDPHSGVVHTILLGTTAPDLPTELTDTDPKTGRILLIGDWADGFPFWIVGPEGVQKGTIPPGSHPSLYRSRLTADPEVILVPEGEWPDEHWYPWTATTPSVRRAAVTTNEEWRSPRIDFWQDWTVLAMATATYSDGARVETVTDTSGAQDLAFRPLGGSATLLTGPLTGQEVP